MTILASLKFSQGQLTTLAQNAERTKLATTEDNTVPALCIPNAHKGLASHLALPTA